MLQNSAKILIFLKKRISTISLKYSAESLKNCCVLKISYECLMMIEREPKHVTIKFRILCEIELCLMRFIFILHDQYKVVFYADETVRSSAALFTRSRRHKFAFRETISYLQSCVQ